MCVHARPTLSRPRSEPYTLKFTSAGSVTRERDASNDVPRGMPLNLGGRGFLRQCIAQVCELFKCGERDVGAQ
eukprot:2375088-Amphidinium_carterae.1